MLECTRVQVYLAHDRPLDGGELSQLRALVQRRGAREPLAWIVGNKEFYGRSFIVTPGVLVPRPDTETLIETMLALLPKQDEPVFVADVGCGTGCIGLTLAAERENVRLFATDLADASLMCTKANATALNLAERVAVLKGDLLSPIPDDRPIDWVVSNPPYIASEVLAQLAPEVSRHEPKLALDGGGDGLATYRRLIDIAAGRTRSGLVVEIGFDQGPPVAQLFDAAGFGDVTVHTDLAERPRVVSGRAPTRS